MSAVYKNKKLSKIEKFNNLKSKLSGDDTEGYFRTFPIK